MKINYDYDEVMSSLGHNELTLLPSGAEAWTLWEQIADALALCITKPSASTALIM